MKMTTVNKVQFASLNVYCPDGITSLPNGHPLLLELRKKKKAFPKIKKVIKEQENNFLQEELNTITKYERINTLRAILSQSITYYKGNNKGTKPFLYNSKMHIKIKVVVMFFYFLLLLLIILYLMFQNGKLQLQ